MNDVLFSHKSDEWGTPQELFDELDAEFNFTLDPCATADNHKCDKYYTREQNGLLKSWKNEIVFCNPPYSKVADWVRKCAYERLIHGTTSVLLIPARTDTKWFHEYIYRGGAEIRFIKGRLKFGDSKNSAPFPSMICIFKPKEEI